MIDQYYPVLDKGFIALKDVMGDDEAIEQAARVSYGKGTRKTSDTRNLIRYLMRHRHTTPFEMVELKFHVRVPMDCWRQWIRHRTASVNEYSTRYSEALNIRHVVQPDEWRKQSTDNKQGSKDFVDDKVGTGALDRDQEILHESVQEVYQYRLERGVAREQARKDLPLSTYTEAYWKIDLHNLFHFLKLRCDQHAQQEIRSYANIMAGIVKEVCPLAFEAWYDYSFQADTLTRLDKTLLWHLLVNIGGLDELATDCKQGGPITTKEADRIGMSKRELNEFWEKLDYHEVQFELPQPRDYTHFQEMCNAKDNQMA